MHIMVISLFLYIYMGKLVYCVISHSSTSLFIAKTRFRTQQCTKQQLTSSLLFCFSQKQYIVRQEMCELNEG